MLRFCLLCALRVLATLTLLSSFALYPLSVQARQWTDNQGHAIDAKLVSFDGKLVVLNAAGTEYKLTLSQLSEADQQYLKTLSSEPSSTSKKPDIAAEDRQRDGTIPQYRLHTRMFLNTDDFFKDYALKGAEKYFEEHSDGRFKYLLNYAPGSNHAQVYIPESYTGKIPYGLYIHLGSGDKPRLERNYYPVFTKHKLIGVSPYKTAAERGIPWSISQALDCIATLSKDYNIDKKRIYIGGFSTGGKAALLAAMFFPEQFHGVASSCAGLTLLPDTVEDPKKKGYHFPSDVPYFDEKDFKKIAQHPIRWVFFSGTKNAEHEQIKLDIPHWEALGFDLRFYEIRGMGLDDAPKVAFEKAIDWLDQ